MVYLTTEKIKNETMELSRIIFSKFVKYLNILKQIYFLLSENSCFHKTATRFTSTKFKKQFRYDVFLHAKTPVLRRITKTQNSKPKQGFKLHKFIKKVLNDEVETESLKSYSTIDVHSCSETSSIFDDEIRVNSNFSHNDDRSSFDILTTNDFLSTASTPPDAPTDRPSKIFASSPWNIYTNTVISNISQDQKNRTHENLSSWSNSSYDVISSTNSNIAKAKNKYMMQQRDSPTTSLFSWTSSDSSILEPQECLTSTSTAKLTGSSPISSISCSRLRSDLNPPEQSDYSKNDAAAETKRANITDSQLTNPWNDNKKCKETETQELLHQSVWPNTEVGVGQYTEETQNNKNVLFMPANNQQDMGFVGECDWPINQPQQFPTGILCNAPDVSMLNSTQKSFVSESSFNFDDPRFKSVSPKGSRFQTDYKTSIVPAIKPIEGNRHDWPTQVQQPHEFVTGVWGNTRDAPMLNSSKKTTASESSFNFDDPRFKSVSPKTSHFQTNFKPLATVGMEPNEEKKGLLCNFSHLAANVGRYVAETTNTKTPFESANNQQDKGLVAGCNNWPVQEPQQFTTGVWGNTHDVPVLNSTKKFSASNSSFNFDDPRFKSVSPKASRCEEQNKTSHAPEMKPYERADDLLCDYSRVLADTDQNAEENPNNEAPFEGKNNQKNMGLIGGCDWPMPKPQQFTAGVWGNTCDVPVLNSTKKSSVSESSFNFDDPRFKSVSPKASRCKAQNKTACASEMKPNERADDLLCDYSRILADIDQNTEENPNNEAPFEGKNNQKNMGLIGGCDWPMPKPQQFTAGVWGNTRDVPVLNSTKKSSVSESSFNFDDPRFKSVSPKASRCKAQNKTACASEMKPNERADDLLCDYSRILADIDQNTEENPNNEAPFEGKNNQKNMGLIGGCDWPMPKPQQFTAGVWGNTCDVPVLNSTKKSSVSESSFNFDDPRFKSVSLKTSRCKAQNKTACASEMKPYERADDLLCDYSRILADIDQNIEENPNNEAPFEGKNNQKNMGLIGGCDWPMPKPQQFTAGVWGNTCDVPVLNSTKKSSVSESSFNFDDPRFKSVSPKTSRFQSNCKSSDTPRTKPNEGKESLCDFSQLLRFNCGLQTKQANQPVKKQAGFPLFGVPSTSKAPSHTKAEFNSFSAAMPTASQKKDDATKRATDHLLQIVKTQRDQINGLRLKSASDDVVLTEHREILKDLSREYTTKARESHKRSLKKMVRAQLEETYRYDARLDKRVSKLIGLQKSWQEKKELELKCKIQHSWKPFEINFDGFKSNLVSTPLERIAFDIKKKLLLNST